MEKKKAFSDYWKVIRIPFFVLFGWSFAALVVELISFDTYVSIFGSWSGLILSVAVFAFLGYTAVKDYGFGQKETAKAGALCGAFAGIAGAILGIVAMFVAPQLMDYALSAAMERAPTVDPDMMASMIKIQTYLGVIIAPIINAGIGALLAWITSLVVKRE
ncbi:hypothetical protein JXA85_01780 [Candidatus Woesearchaeota archaeon]|nr:hypothetical protein [Candidatus Woesearchaeota archaeon]